MKRFLAPILFAVLLFPALAMGETMDDLMKRDGFYYREFTDVPFTGKVTGKEQGSFKNGKRDGPWVYYHKDGQLRYKGNWKDDKMDGPWVAFNKDGTVYPNLTGIYKNGVKVSD